MLRINQTLTGSLLVLLGASCYGFFAIFTKLAYYDGNLSPLDVTIWRFLFASVAIWLLFPLWRQRVDWRELDSKRFVVFLGLGMLMAAFALAAFFALDRVSATTYTLLLYTFPAMVAVASLALGERLPLVGWAALGLALVGCALTIGGEIAVDDPVGITLVLLNAMLYGAYMMAVGRLGRGSSVALSTAIIIPGALITLAPVGIAFGLQAPRLLQGWLAIVGLSVVSTVLPITLVFAGTLKIGASRASILSTLEPVLTVVWAAILLGEHVEPLQYIGGGLIVASVLLLNIPSQPSEPLPEPNLPE